MGNIQKRIGARAPIILCALGLSALPASELLAAPKGDASAQALRKAQGMLRELSQQKTQLESDNAKLIEQNKSLEATVKRLEPLQDEVSQQKTSIEGLKANTGALETQLGSERSRYQKLLDRHQQVIAQAKKIQADNFLLVNAVKEREEWIVQCGKNNQGLQQANRELIERYKEKGFWDKVAQLEPFTGIGKVAAENAEQEYQFKLKDLQITPFKKEAAAAANNQAEPQEPAAEQPAEAEDDGE